MDGRDELPGYLADVPQTGHIYGRLSYNRRSKCWTIKGEPCVTEMAGRLFPGSVRRRGEVRFSLVEELRSQLKRDRQRSMEILGGDA